jgi:hypothetical protein
MSISPYQWRAYTPCEKTTESRHAWVDLQRQDGAVVESTKISFSAPLSCLGDVTSWVSINDRDTWRHLVNGLGNHRCANVSGRLSRAHSRAICCLPYCSGEKVINGSIAGSLVLKPTSRTFGKLYDTASIWSYPYLIVRLQSSEHPL